MGIYNIVASKNKTAPPDVRFSNGLAKLLINMESDNKIKKWIKEMVDKL